jgi:hypothetical protein
MESGLVCWPLTGGLQKSESLMVETLLSKKSFKDEAVTSIQVEFSQRVPNGLGHVRSFNLIVTL